MKECTMCALTSAEFNTCIFIDCKNLKKSAMKSIAKITSGVNVEVRLALTHLEKALAFNEAKYKKQNEIYWATVADSKKWGNGIEAEKLDSISKDGQKIKDSIAMLSKFIYE